MAEVSLTVTTHKTERRVLWAETDKNFVDFLFCLFSIPMGQVLHFLNDNESFGCLNKAYQSVHLMEKDFMLCDKDDILKPKFFLSSLPSLLKIEKKSPITLDSCTTLNLVSCTCAMNAFALNYGTCFYCKKPMKVPVKHYVPNPEPTNTCVDVETSVFVKGGGVKYIVTDDLSVTSKCRFSFLEYFKTMNVVDLNGLEEKVVNVDVEKCKKLLKLALTANHMVLTKLFKDELGF